ncbi:MAG: glycerol-3-phosphate acyltransferase [Phycisphaeraceae bacterium]|nr:MAG: glycerol-3-phosphate acyltransferase [Phycisphaeraceae bacterium]
MSAEAGWILWIVVGYVAGSIPFGLIIGLMRGVDPRAVGSGNIGATNVWRVVGRPFGMLCFALDLAKGFAPVFIAGWTMGALGAVLSGAGLAPAQAWWWLAVMGAPIVGHIYPVWLRFRGGKGVATGFGATLGVWPAMALPALGALVVWIVCRRLTRNVGFSSSVAAALFPVFFLAMEAGGLLGDLSGGAKAAFLIVSGALAALVIWRHRENLSRTFSDWFGKG